MIERKKRGIKTWVILCLSVCILVSGLYTGETSTQAASKMPNIKYAVRCKTTGWTKQVVNAKTAGKAESGNGIQAIAISLDMKNREAKDGSALTGTVRFRMHQKGIGWTSWTKGDNRGANANQMAKDGEYGTISKTAEGFEAIQIKLSGKIAKEYDILYRVYTASQGWSAWAKNGASAGSLGKNGIVEAIQIKCSTKETAPAKLSYFVSAQGKGWSKSVASGKTAGTPNKNQALLGLKLRLNTYGIKGNIEYTVRPQDGDWKPVVKNGTALSTGKTSIEAVKIYLSGNVTAYYDLYYRVYASGIGWLDWAKNGSPAGIKGAGRYVEAIQVLLAEKDKPAPGSMKQAYRELEPEHPTKDTYVIKVNKEACCVTVYQADVPVKAFACSPGDATPIGTFHLAGQWRWNTLMGGVEGQYCSQIYGNFLFHSILYNERNIRTLIPSSYNDLGKRVSHGCVRLRVADAKWIFDNCPTGTKIIIYNSPDPGPLGKPDYGTIPASQTWDPSDPGL